MVIEYTSSQDTKGSKCSRYRLLFKVYSFFSVSGIPIYVIFKVTSLCIFSNSMKIKILFIHHIMLAQSQTLQKPFIFVYSSSLLLSSGPFFRSFATQTWEAFYNVLHDLWKRKVMMSANKWRWRNDPVKAKITARYPQENVWPFQSTRKPGTKWAAVQWGFFQRITWDIPLEPSHKDRTIWKLTSENGHTNW